VSKICRICGLSISNNNRTALCLSCRKHNNYLNIKEKVIQASGNRWKNIKIAEGRPACIDCGRILNKNNTNGRCGRHYKQIVSKEKRREYSNNCRAASRENRLKRYRGDVYYRLRIILRARLCAAIKNNQKVGSAIADLGCSIEELRAYLESRWQPGMSWDNYGQQVGKWNIDHIIPLSAFNLSDRNQLLKACHYSNLQPLWAVNNYSKGDKIV
jgi:hypothetical protein